MPVPEKYPGSKKGSLKESLTQMAQNPREGSTSGWLSGQSLRLTPLWPRKTAKSEGLSGKAEVALEHE